MKEAVPFLRLPDGAVVAFWYHSPSPAIVLIGGHGESKVIAQDFDNFLKGIGASALGCLSSMSPSALSVCLGLQESQ